MFLAVLFMFLAVLFIFLAVLFMFLAFKSFDFTYVMTILLEKRLAHKIRYLSFY